MTGSASWASTQARSLCPSSMALKPSSVADSMSGIGVHGLRSVGFESFEVDNSVSLGGITFSTAGDLFGSTEALLPPSGGYPEEVSTPVGTSVTSGGDSEVISPPESSPEHPLL